MAEPATEKKGSPASLLIALGGLKKPPGAASEPDGDESLEGAEEPSMGDVKSTASADAMAAVKSGDAAAFEDALTRFFEACSSEGYK